MMEFTEPELALGIIVMNFTGKEAAKLNAAGKETKSLE
jgi:hypothetical protein